MSHSIECNFNLGREGWNSSKAGDLTYEDIVFNYSCGTVLDSHQLRHYVLIDTVNGFQYSIAESVSNYDKDAILFERKCTRKTAVFPRRG